MHTTVQWGVRHSLDFTVLAPHGHTRRFKITVIFLTKRSLVGEAVTLNGVLVHSQGYT